MSEEEKYYHQVCEAIDGSIKSQMFGKPCYKLNKKAFCCFLLDTSVLQSINSMDTKATSSKGKIFVLNEGKIVETGTHESLSAIEDGLYNSLAKLQFDSVE